MKTRYSVWMNNQGLQDLDERIYITDIKENDPKQRMITAEKPIGGGTRLLRVMRESLSVVVRFAVREYDTARRRDILTRIRAWAREGYLSTSDRPGQRLYVVCEKIPTADSALKWTGEMEMTLTAYAVPWWEDETPTRATYTGTNGTAALMCRGDEGGLLDAEITTAGTVTSMSIKVNGRSFVFSGLSLAGGSRVTISHDKDGVLSIKAGSVSLLPKRTAASADELLLASGGNTITFTANASCTAVFSARGRYA